MHGKPESTPTRSVREHILEMLADGQKHASEMMELPYSRNTIQIYLKSMVEGGEVFRFGRGRKTTYSLDNVQKMFPKKKVEKLVLPDLPPIMLKWGGYTDKEPNPNHGYIIYGEF